MVSVDASVVDVSWLCQAVASVGCSQRSQSKMSVDSVSPYCELVVSVGGVNRSCPSLMSVGSIIRWCQSVVCIGGFRLLS